MLGDAWLVLCEGTAGGGCTGGRREAKFKIFPLAVVLLCGLHCASDFPQPHPANWEGTGNLLYI